MSDKPLPRPVSSTDFYLAAILGELQKQNAQPEDADAEAAGMIELREPLVVEALPLAEPDPTPLPDDFPGKAALETAGIAYLEDVPRTGKELTAVSGIGTVTANQILTWFALEGRVNS
jgi:hypothetical protein